MAVGARDERTWTDLCRALGKGYWASQLQDQSEWEDIRAELRAIFLTRTRQEWWQFFQDKGSAVAPVLTLDEVSHDPQVLQRQMLLELELPNGGKTVHYGIAMKLQGTPGKVRSLPPGESQHTTAVLKRLGYDDARIQELRASGAVH